MFCNISLFQQHLHTYLTAKHPDPQIHNTNLEFLWFSLTPKQSNMNFRSERTGQYIDSTRLYISIVLVLSFMFINNMDIVAQNCTISKCHLAWSKKMSDRPTEWQKSLFSQNLNVLKMLLNYNSQSAFGSKSADISKWDFPSMGWHTPGSSQHLAQPQPLPANVPRTPSLPRSR